MSLDLRVLWRVGMTDAQALRAAYSAADPAALTRAAAGRAVAAFFAGQTLAQVLGENRETMAEQLRGAIQARLDGFASGLEVVAVAIEAIHPPAGAADAYHAVQAAEIVANASVAAERGRAQGVAAAAAQTASETTNGARALAAEALGVARADLIRFTADRDAAQAGGASFPLERYFAALSSALTRAPLTILDHRVAAGDAPVLDIRPPAAAQPTTPGAE
jgi:regulator of protease activity HflC (stomatin/prohibitin superfamily)